MADPTRNGIDNPTSIPRLNVLEAAEMDVAALEEDFPYSESGSESEEDLEDYDEDMIDADEIRDKLGLHLDNATSIGSFAYHAQLKDVPNPGLHIRGHGTIAFPIGEREIGIIKAASCLSPLEEEGEDGLLLPRKLWRVPGDMIELQNPSWKRILKDILTTLDKELISGRGVKAIRSWLTLHEPSNTVCHRESFPPADSSFGVLELTFASKHSGGELILKQGEREKTYQSSEGSDYDLSYSAWFSDVEGQSRPVTSGHKITLTYELRHSTPGPVCSAAALGQELAQLQLILKSWHRQQQYMEHEALGYILEEHYGTGKLTFERLSGQDLLAVAQLKEACASTGFYICLANVQREVEGNHNWDEPGFGNHHYMEHVHSSTTRLATIVDLSGKEILPGHAVDFEDKQFTQDDAFDNIVDEDFDKYHGNLTHVYHHNAVIIMPYDTHMSFFYKTPSAYFKRLLSHPNSLNHDLYRRENITRVCNKVLKNISWGSGTTTLDQSSVLLLFKVIALLDDAELFGRALPLRLSAPDEIRPISEMIRRHGIPWFERCLEDELLKVRKFSIRFDAILKIERAWDCRPWAAKQRQLAVSSLKLVTVLDGRNLARMAKVWAGRPELTRILVPALKRNMRRGLFKSTTMIMAFLEKIALLPQVPRSIFEGLVAEAASTFTLFLFKKSESPEHHANTARVMLHCHELSLTAEMNTIIQKIVDSQAGQGPSIAFYLETIHLPLLQTLAAEIQRYSANVLSHPQFRGLYQHVLSRCASMCIGPRPIPPIDWVRRASGICRCNYCGLLDAFLVHPDRQAHTFSYPTATLNHLKGKLGFFIRTRTIAVEHVRNNAQGQGLRVQKTQKTYNDLLAAWNAKPGIVKDLLAGCGVERLKILLGEHFDDIMALTSMPLPAPPPSPTAVPVRVEVVDLTADSEEESSQPQIVPRPPSPPPPQAVATSRITRRSSPEFVGTATANMTAEPALELSSMDSLATPSSSSAHAPSTIADQQLGRANAPRAPLAEASSAAVNRMLLSPTRRRVEAEEDEANKRRRLGNGGSAQANGRE